MINNFEIKPATKSDVPIILEMIKQLAAFGNLTHELTATEESLSESLFGAKPYAEVIIGYLNHQPVSYALFLHSFSTLHAKPGLYLVDLFVAAEARSKGIGKEMIGYLTNLAQERKCVRFEGSVHKSNQSAIQLYEALGGKALNEWTTYRSTVAFKKSNAL